MKRIKETRIFEPLRTMRERTRTTHLLYTGGKATRLDEDERLYFLVATSILILSFYTASSI
jgi:hypothetical protein